MTIKTTWGPTPTRRALLLSTVALAATTAIPQGVWAETEPTRGGTVSINIGTEPPVLVLIAHSAGAAYYVSGKATESLLTYDRNFAPQPLLATEWTVSKDGLRYWFKLRKGVKWHDGRDFTAEDVAFSILALKENHPRGRATFASVQKANVLGSHEVELLLSKPAPYLLSAFASFEAPIVPKHLYEGTKIAENPHNVAPVGTGPYKFVEWVRGSHALFERNENYWGAPKPYLDQIIFRFIIDPAAAVAAIETGEVQISTANLPLTDIERLKANPNLVVDTAPAPYSPSIARAEFNLENKYLADIKVRHAIAHAIDKDFIVNTVYLGYATRLDGPVSPDLVKFYTPDLPKYDFSPEKAEKLLDEAGYKRGADGFRFKLFIDPTQPSGPPKQTAEYFAQALSKVGIKVELRSQDFATFVKRIFTDRDFDIAIEGMSNLYDPTVGIQRLYWSKNFKPGVPFTNGSRYSNPDVDRLLEAAAVEIDEKKRLQLFKEFQTLVVQDLPTLDIVTPSVITVYDKRIKNLKIGVEDLWSNGAEISFES
ncbi:peptide/nickel transport system substrate-binding protein [Rhizobium sp. PP-F2F-G38]|uniref:ABC transporter substrate-binding protein n=1 Tax=Ferranicluibacter rubi TaxID=2715133 RepID=A0AA44CA85_9HYPH|nr:ABC transporter substrate-binding protein [Ferranicluibacter rubi]NHT75573.1 ABC transporter substrate-binding protein [Ferranicluibacter rubi]PYE30907.1 peptide/nickel transport system substrate-binding protein [Rhizobium sp. PP-WC-1G-195]PYE94401.1 peptide/nickel transport system substrate-binding protein [Rhizobium sp. PP-F2F-G38]